ncbi:TIGR03364 family FAD-dependent oxidoreductase [Asticcacaulis sp. AC402]|uniref:TIGR03364 family FAD-dependent oxidoreductase n=1 Tax=Asticcacaulis sp. AC402 TaxID=1282361 RepID=UPI0003C3E171|nr:TIGR03364 family FAD-dependent oxidoreductase [Asticcacaulis sp. AC402]ESQ73811.1 hypothetical protein ABAC402_17345 [Asticcacaulis sp. AC402]
MTAHLLNSTHYDLAIVGGGVLGLAHAWLARRSGLRVVLVERHPQALGASVRNFGLITVSGQQRGAYHALSLRSRDLWRDLLTRLNLVVQHDGLFVAVRRPEAIDVLEAFLATEMGTGCRLLRPQDTSLAFAPEVSGVLYSPHELRIDSRQIIPALTTALQNQGVDIIPGCQALAAGDGELVTTLGRLRARQIVVCQGDALSGLFSERLAQYQVTRCKLQMLRLAAPGFTLPSAVMSDLGLVRYLGYAELPQAEALRRRLMAEQPAHLAEGVHLIVVQNGDGSLTVGDSHVYGDAPTPFGRDEVDALILDEFRHVLGAPPPVVERWIGTYASSDRQLYVVDQPADDIRSVVVTSGTGATTSLAIAEQTLTSLGVDLHDIAA